MRVYRIVPTEKPPAPKTERPGPTPDYVYESFRRNPKRRDEFERDIDWWAWKRVKWERDNAKYFMYLETNMIKVGDEYVEPEWPEGATEMYRIEVPAHDKVVIVPADEVVGQIKELKAEFPEIAEGVVGYSNLEHSYKDSWFQVLQNVLYSDQTGLQLGFEHDEANEDMVHGKIVDVEQDEHHIVLDTYRNKLQIVLPDDYEEVATRRDIRPYISPVVTGLQEVNLVPRA